jgi:hypothetical protein
MKLSYGLRRGIASVIGTIFFVLVIMAALGAQAYMWSLQAQSTQVAQQAQSVAAGKADELLLYSAPSLGLTVSDSGPTTTKVIAMVLKFENGSVYSLSSASSPSFVSATFPQGTNALVQSLVPTSTSPCKDQNNVGTATCLSKYNSIVNNVVGGRSVGLVTSLGNAFWYVPSTSLVQWSSVANLPAGCSANQYVTAVGATLTCSQVGWTQLTGYPSGCGANQYVTAVGSTLICSSVSVGWSGLSGFPTGCSYGQFVTQVGSTLTCSAPGDPPATATPWTTSSSYSASGGCSYTQYFTVASHAVPSGKTSYIYMLAVSGANVLDTSNQVVDIRIYDSTAGTVLFSYSPFPIQFSSTYGVSGFTLTNNPMIFSTVQPTAPAGHIVQVQIYIAYIASTGCGQVGNPPYNQPGGYADVFMSGWDN